MMNALKRIPLELLLWIGAIVSLGFAEPIGHEEGNHFSFCLLANMDVHWCPGCGLGRSLTQLLHGNIRESLALHWFGVPALLIIAHRIWMLAGIEVNNFKTKNKEDKYV